MKTMLALAIVLLLTGCGLTTNVKRTFPVAPESLTQDCGDLLAAKESDKLSDLLTVVNENYARYHNCRNKVDGWNRWHAEQQRVFDQVK